MSVVVSRVESHGISSVAVAGISISGCILMALLPCLMVKLLRWTEQCMGIRPSRLCSKKGGHSSEDQLSDLESGALPQSPPLASSQEAETVLQENRHQSLCKKSPKGQMKDKHLKSSISKPTRLLPPNQPYILVRSPFDRLALDSSVPHQSSSTPRPTLRRPRSLDTEHLRRPDVNKGHRKKNEKYAERIRHIRFCTCSLDFEMVDIIFEEVQPPASHRSSRSQFNPVQSQQEEPNQSRSVFSQETSASADRHREHSVNIFRSSDISLDSATQLWVEFQRNIGD